MVPLDETTNSFNHKERGEERREGKRIANRNQKKIVYKVRRDTNKRGAPQSTLRAASLTVEAALVFPLFLFLLIGLLFFFRVLQVSHMTYGALEVAGSRLSLEIKEEEAPFARMAGYFYGALAKGHFPYEYLKGGAAGIRWTGTELAGEYVDLWIHYECRMPVHLPGLRNIPITQRVRMKKWIGCENGFPEGEDGIWVYVTPNESVYHLSRECTHLRLSIRRIGKYEAGQSGYKPCGICGDSSGMYPYYYVTDEGEKYHTKLGCSGLKRTLYMVRLSDVDGLRACSRCKGGSWKMLLY